MRCLCMNRWRPLGDERVWIRVLEWFCNFEERNGMLTISDEVLESARISANELQQEIAVYLYSKNKLSFGQARKIAGLNVFQFQDLLCKNDIPIHYSIEELEEDYQTIQRSLNK